MHESIVGSAPSVNIHSHELDCPTLDLGKMSLDQARGHIQPQLVLFAAGSDESKAMEWLMAHMGPFRREYPTAGQAGEEKTRELIARWNAAEKGDRLNIL